MDYNLTQEQRHSLSSAIQNLDNQNGSRSAPTAQPTGCSCQVQTADTSCLPVTGTLSPNTNEPTIRRVSDLPVGARLVYQFTDSTTMNNPTTFCVVLASYITAGLFGVAFVQTALTESFQQHSGTQSYVRVIR